MKFLFILLLILALTPLFARDVEITVIDTDLDLPLEGALIRSYDGSQHICDEDGKAIINAPEDRRVVIQVSYPGYETGRLLITEDNDRFTLGLLLSGTLQIQELVIEAYRPGENETKTGRSVAISGQDISQTKIGAIEDTMASIKLLPGIIATEHFDASPSVRGGDPDDVNASLDGFYVTSPYFWGGAFSIFDPRMIESAQLSHGVFSSRYGHTVSGLLDLTTKKPSRTENELELGTDASALRLNISFPLNGKGGILFMGRVTYIEPIFFLAQQIVNSPEVSAEAGDIKDLVNSINRAPFIRSGTVTGNYNFADNLELSGTAFFGVDGTGVKFENDSSIGGFESYDKFALDYTYYQGFLTSALGWNPRNDMLLKFTAGIGATNRVFDEENIYNIYDKSYSQCFKTNYDDLSKMGLADFSENYTYDLKERSFNDSAQIIYNIQGRIDFDWDLGNNLLFAAGTQQMVKQYRATGKQDMRTETWLKDSDYKEEIFTSLGINNSDDQFFMEENVIVSSPALSDYNILGNALLNSSGYSLIEYTSPRGFFGSELGLRIDYYNLWGKNTLLESQLILNPRLNMDFNILKDRFIFNSVAITIGTGLFSSMPDAILAIEDPSEIRELKPTRSWTSVIGTNLRFPFGINFNIEGYYKYIFDRMYSPISYDLTGNIDTKHYFNGEGRSWGIDVMLQKTRSRYFDGWISYSYNWTQHRDPSASAGAKSFETNLNTDAPFLNNDWYFPSYHRFHSLNLILNIKPVQHINIFTRFGLASGVQLSKRVGREPESYPVYIYNPATQSGEFIEKYFWPEIQDQNNRTTPSLQMDMKVSFYRVNNNGKTRVEAYFALENILSVLYWAQGNEVFNPYTGEIATGRTAASYGLPFPIPSFGVNLYY